MATMPATISRTGANLGIRSVAWDAMATGDDGTPVEMPDMPDRSIQVTGTFSGSTVTIQGSNDASSPTNWFTLTAPSGLPLTFTAAGLSQVLEITNFVRPVVTAGTGSAFLVRMVAR